MNIAKLRLYLAFRLWIRRHCWTHYICHLTLCNMRDRINRGSALSPNGYRYIPTKQWIEEWSGASSLGLH